MGKFNLITLILMIFAMFFWGIILFVYGPNADDSVVGYAFIYGCVYFKVFNHISKLIFVCDQHETNCQVVIGGIFFDLSSLIYCCFIYLKIIFLYRHIPGNIATISMAF